MQLPKKIINLWDIMKNIDFLALADTLSFLNKTEALAHGEGRVPWDKMNEYYRPRVEKARQRCVTLELPCAVRRCNRFLHALQKPGLNWAGLKNQAAVLREEIEGELSSQVSIKINAERLGFYETPFLEWEKIIKRFGSITRDVEEMNKCFALSRYTAAMFHAMQIAELGAIELGNYIGVTDPKKGWGATQKALRTPQARTSGSSACSIWKI